LAISQAVLAREAPALADKAVYAAQRDDAITVRDRLLTLVETVVTRSVAGR